MAWKFTICDVFTERPLAGNQLAVFTDAKDIPEPLLQPIAREINFSETVFVYPPAKGGDARLRIFSPVAELRFAGHPVLGTAVVIGAATGQEEIRLETGIGLTPVTIQREGARITGGRMRQSVPMISPWRYPEALLAALGIANSWLPVELYDNGMLHLFVALDSRDAVRELAPDPNDLADILRGRGIPIAGINCFAGAGADWKTRMFSPADGVDEDPATGSAAGPLACHLVRHNVIEPGVELNIRQGAEIGRPSVLHARVDGAPDRITRVEVGGGALIVGRGEFDEEALGLLLQE